MKALFDDKMKVKVPDFAVGESVRIKKPGLLTKNDSKFGHPIKIVKDCKNSVITQDGKVWNMGKVAKCKMLIYNTAQVWV